MLGCPFNTKQIATSVIDLTHFGFVPSAPERTQIETAKYTLLRTYFDFRLSLNYQVSENNSKLLLKFFFV